jgi:CRISPR-associated endonuclease/helicase Cas3
MLRGGDEIEALVADKPLAKSGMDPRDRAAFRMAFRSSGLPRGYRHEAASLALLETEPEALEAANDPDLVRHLVASHHGAARPFLPPIDDDDVAVAIRWDGLDLSGSARHGLWHIGSGVGERFWSLVRRCGWYGLAYLEAILRLADHRCSESEAQRGGAQ